MSANEDPRSWTYGAEHELADWDTRLFDERLAPLGFGRDVKDNTIVNSNGIANDPKGKLYPFGGEITTPPTTNTCGQLDCLDQILRTFPEATINYRSNLHVHVRVPGLKDDLPMLKQVQRYIHEWMPKALPLIEPIPIPGCCAPTQEGVEEFEGAMRRAKRRKVSHHTLLTHERLALQLSATTTEEFFNREVPWSAKLGKPQWQCQPRLCVNLRQLLQTDTVEFRHFPGTLRRDELETALLWAKQFLLYAINDRPLQELLDNLWTLDPWPEFLPYDHKLETGYRRTCHDGSLKKSEIAANIKEILS